MPTSTTVGWLPRLVAAGYRGRVYCTPGTRDLCTLVLPDAGRIQEEDARQANKHDYTKHAPARPLFTEDDARRALTLLQPVGFGVPLPVVPGLTAEFIRAGHLLGSSFIRVTQDDAPRTILFGGDLGRYDRPVLPDPTPVAEADVLLLESTYGNRIHEPDDDGASLAAVIVRHLRTRRTPGHPVVRDWPRRGTAVLAATAREGGAHPVDAHVRGQPDGRRGAELLQLASRRTRPGDAPGRIAGRCSTRAACT